MALNDDIKELLTAFGVQMTEDLQKSLASKGQQFANSRLHGAIGSALSNSTFANGTFKITFKIPNYYYWVDEGRKPGNVAESANDSIGEWANSRGYLTKFINQDLLNRQREQIAAKQRRRNKRKENKNIKKFEYKKLEKRNFEKAKEQFVFLVKRKVARDGYSSKAKGFFSDVYNDGRIEALTKALTDLLQKDIVIELVSDYKKTE